MFYVHMHPQIAMNINSKVFSLSEIISTKSCNSLFPFYITKNYFFYACLATTVRCRDTLELDFSLHLSIHKIPQESHPCNIISLIIYVSMTTVLLLDRFR